MIRNTIAEIGLRRRDAVAQIRALLRSREKIVSRQDAKGAKKKGFVVLALLASWREMTLGNLNLA
jgi:hypothetical protein